MHPVTLPQLLLLCLSIVLIAMAWGMSLSQPWWERESLRIGSKVSLYLAMTAALGGLVWHSASRGSWVPLEDNFDALVWLGLLLSLFVVYTQRVHPLRGLDWFVLPIVAMLLVSAAIFGKATPHEYHIKSIWSWAHRVTTYGGAVAFAIAGAVGAMYLVVNRRLRAKLPTKNLGSLERLEHLTRVSVTLGFSLLTIGCITGALMFEEGKRVPVYKIVLAATVWVVYALVLHTPINPSFRGSKAAVLSVVGFLLMIGTLVAVQFIPSR